MVGVGEDTRVPGRTPAPKSWPSALWPASSMCSFKDGRSGPGCTQAAPPETAPSCQSPSSGPRGGGGHRPTLLGCTARRRFSIHLSRSAADRQEKHLLPDDVVTCGGPAGQRHRGRDSSKEVCWRTSVAWGTSTARSVCITASGRRQSKTHNDPISHVCRWCTETCGPQATQR